MALRIMNTATLTSPKVKMVVYGQIGVGKTRLATTAPKPLVLSAESGLLSLQGCDVPFIHISSPEELLQALEWLKTSPDAERFETIILDSISEMSYQIKKQIENEQKAKVDKEKKKDTVNNWQLYADIGSWTVDTMVLFRDLPKHVVLLGQEQRKTLGEGAGQVISIQLEGNKATERLPYLYDIVVNMRFADEVGKTGDRYFQTASDNIRVAKDRSGRLEPIEPADIGYVFNKILGKQPE